MSTKDVIEAISLSLKPEQPKPIESEIRAILEGLQGASEFLTLNTFELKEDLALLNSALKE